MGLTYSAAVPTAASVESLATLAASVAVPRSFSAPAFMVRRRLLITRVLVPAGLVTVMFFGTWKPLMTCHVSILDEPAMIVSRTVEVVWPTGVRVSASR